MERDNSPNTDRMTNDSGRPGWTRVRRAPTRPWWSLRARLEGFGLQLRQKHTRVGLGEDFIWFLDRRVLVYLTEAEGEDKTWQPRTERVRHANTLTIEAATASDREEPQASDVDLLGVPNPPTPQVQIHVVRVETVRRPKRS